MFILHPDPYLQPAYRISPFRTIDIAFNSNLDTDNYIEEYFNLRFSGKRYQYTLTGREAINLALSYYRLKMDDIVTILTTTGNFYISGCVTKEIEKFCKWSHELMPETKVVLINHEFGFPYPMLHKLKDLRLPIIEDCAGSFFSEDTYNDIGNIGDFVIYSFPKIFPMQVGGLLVSNIPDVLHSEIQHKIDDELLRHIKNVLSAHIGHKEEIIKRRILNYDFLRNRFELLGVSARFELTAGDVPAVFMFRTNNLKINLPELKIYYNAHGVQCSIFYGEETFFIPVHQSLTEQDLNYFVEVFKSFISRKQ